MGRRKMEGDYLLVDRDVRFHRNTMRCVACLSDQCVSHTSTTGPSPPVTHTHTTQHTS